MTRSPPASSPAVAKSMRSNKSKNTKPELALKAALRASGAGCFTVNDRGLPGAPDICFPEAKVAVFVNGCFWHRCPSCDLPLPKRNTEFWRSKFERNVERDSENREKLKGLGWRPLVIWECELAEDLPAAVCRVREAVTMKCARCGDEYVPKRVGRGRYCSRRCGGLANMDRVKRSEFKCVECGAAYEAKDYPYLVGFRERRYCSERCYSRVTQRRAYWRVKEGTHPATRKFRLQMSRRKRKRPGLCRDCAAPLTEGSGYRCEGCQARRREWRAFR